MEITLRPTIKQDQAWQKLQDKVTKFIVFGGGAGGGKSWLGAEWLMTNAYLYPSSKWFIGREELTRLMKSSYITFRKVSQFHKIPKDDWKLNGQYSFIEFKNGTRIDLLDLKYLPSDPLYERFGSLEYTGGWIEEAGEVKFDAFDILKSRIGRHMNRELDLPSKLLITCNPKKNWLYQDIYKPFRDGDLRKEYAFIQSLYGDNPYTADEYGKNLSEIKNKSLKQRLMYGNWEYEDDPGTLLHYDAIVDIFTNTVERSERKFLTADIARFGDDKTVVMLWKGWEVYKVEQWEKQGLDVTADRIREILKNEKIPFSYAIVDEDGIGGGIVDMVRGIKGFIANHSQFERKGALHKSQNFRNLKAQVHVLMCERINKRNIAIKTNDEKFKTALIEELEQIRIKDPDKEQKTQIIPKEEIKELLGRSPDNSDALMMRMWFELNGVGVEKAEPTFIFKQQKRKMSVEEQHATSLY